MEKNLGNKTPKVSSNETIQNIIDGEKGRWDSDEISGGNSYNGHEDGIELKEWWER